MRIALAPYPEFRPPRGIGLRILGRDDIPLLVTHLTGLMPEGDTTASTERPTWPGSKTTRGAASIPA